MPSSRLWVVATPIGNPGDLSPRAMEILASADLILAEDTRRAARLLAQYGIRYKKMLSFHEHNEAERQNGVLASLRDGATVALISDAGTPLLADPGYRLVCACREAGFDVSPVPGAFAPAAALSAAGLPPVPFTFLGFLPRSQGEKKALFTAFASVPGTLVFFERKNRLAESLGTAFASLGDRKLAICRELTKTYEEFIIGSLADFKALSDSLLGELTVIIGPPVKIGNVPRDEVEAMISDCRARGLKPRAIARYVSKRCEGWTASEIYSLLYADN